MEIKNLKIGDKFYCLTQTGENEYKVLPHYVAALEANAYGEIIKYVENGVILQMDARFCETDFAKCVASVEAANQGYLVCSACGKALKGKDILSVGNVKICRECYEILHDEVSTDRAEPENLRENVDVVATESQESSFENGDFMSREEIEAFDKLAKKTK